MSATTPILSLALLSVIHEAPGPVTRKLRQLGSFGGDRVEFCREMSDAEGRAVKAAGECRVIAFLAVPEIVPDRD